MEEKKVKLEEMMQKARENPQKMNKEELAKVLRDRVKNQPQNRPLTEEEKEQARERMKKMFERIKQGQNLKSEVTGKTLSKNANFQEMLAKLKENKEKMLAEQQNDIVVEQKQEEIKE